MWHCTQPLSTEAAKKYQKYFLNVQKNWRLNLVLSDNASRHCGMDGAWAERTDYSACKLLEQDSGVMEEVEIGEGPADLEISIIIYLIGKMSAGVENRFDMWWAHFQKFVCHPAEK